MKSLILSFALISTALAAGPGWHLVWSDEFNGSGQPDPTKWTYEEGFVRNKERQYYTAGRLENARVENGALVLEARKEKFANPHFDSAQAASVDNAKGQAAYAKSANTSIPTADYTSASLVTFGKAAWKYGRIEVRAKIPHGRGIWPAIWMLGTDRGKVKWPDCGEIDIMEFVGFMSHTIHGNVHLPARYSGHVDPVAAHMKATIETDAPYDDFHIYAMEWNSERVSIEFDGKTYLTYQNPHTGPAAWPYDQPMYLLLNVAVGGTWGGQKGIDDAIFPQRMEVDYVRVYEEGPGTKD